jgi:hypothetical protein
VVIACFFLPFFGISCESNKGSIDAITISGAQMVGGCKPGGMLADATEHAERNGSKGSQAQVENVEREPLAVVALLLCVAAFALAWVRKRGALIGVIVVALAGLGAMGGLFVKVSGDLKEAIEKESKHSGDLGKEMEKDTKLSSGSRFGFWLVAIGLAGAAALAISELRRRPPPSPVPPPPVV